MSEYQHLLRGPRLAWWRTLLAFLLTAGFLILAILVLGVVLVATGAGAPLISSLENEISPAAFALINLLLALLIPAALLSTRIAHGGKAGYLSSVAGRLRWKWMLRCMAIALPVYLVYAGLDLLLDWPQSPRPAQWLQLLLLVLVGTPLQAAGEEYLSRGLILQNVGAWFRSPRVAMMVATLVSSALFVAAHGSADPWIVLDLAVVAVACCFLVWRTGGLEAAIALHAVNNMTAMAASIVFGGWGDDFVDEASKGEPLDPLITLVTVGIVVALVLRRARLDGIQRVCQPSAAAATLEAAPAPA